jgi:hypothetical protein
VDKEALKYFLFASIISADNDSYTEDVKQDIIQRYDKYKDCGFDDVDWKYVLEPLGDDSDKYVKLMKE